MIGQRNLNQSDHFGGEDSATAIPVLREALHIRDNFYNNCKCPVTASMSSTGAGPIARQVRVGCP